MEFSYAENTFSIRKPLFLLMEQAINKLRDQARPALAMQGKGCVYQNNKGERCAVGHMFVGRIDTASSPLQNLEIQTKLHAQLGFQLTQEELRCLNVFQSKCHDDLRNAEPGEEFEDSLDANWAFFKTRLVIKESE